MSNDVYCSKKFICPETHSSGYIMCYYNENCPNYDYRFFIRIADCHKVVIIKKKINNLKGMISLIKSIIAVLEDKKKSFTYKDNVFRYRFYRVSMNRHKDHHFEQFIIAKKVVLPKETIVHLNENLNAKLEVGVEKILVIIHADRYTCTLEQWKNKIKLMTDELNAFKTFLEKRL